MNKKQISRKKTNYYTLTKKNTAYKIKKSNKKMNPSKTKKIKKFGGYIKSTNIFNYIKSIGFELETTGLVKLTKIKDEETNNFIVVNSSLTNNDLEFGYEDPNEIIFIIDEKDEKFKITSDTNDDSNFNKNIISIYESLNNNNKTGGGGNDEEVDEEEEEVDEEEEEEDINCKNINIELQIPEFGKFNVKFKENIDSELKNCGTFTDTEFISTFYKPIQNKDIIKYYLFKSIKQTINHLTQLKTYTNNKLLITNNTTKEYSQINIKQVYVLPDTTLIYFNPLKYIDENYNINEDLLFVTQMTFRCNVLYTYRIMIQLLTFIKEDEEKLRNIVKNVEIIDAENDIANIRDVLEFNNKLFNNYQMKQNEEMYKFPLQSEDFKYFKAYMFLIFYKLYIYLNYYLTKNNLLKYSLSFAVRHENNVLYEEAEKYLRKFFSANFTGKKEEYIIQQIRNILFKLLDPKIINNYFYIKTEIRDLHEELLQNQDDKNNFGRPELSIFSYFDYFLTKKRDWLTDNDVDTKSTKFNLDNNDVIIEFRDFPKFLIIELYLTGTQEIKNNLDFNLEESSLSIPISIFKKYMAENGY